MVTTQEYLNHKYPTQVEKEQVEEIVWIEQKNIDGGELDLGEYKNLKKVIIYGDCLKSPLTKLLLDSHPHLTELSL